MNMFVGGVVVEESIKCATHSRLKQSHNPCEEYWWVEACLANLPSTVLLPNTPTSQGMAAGNTDSHSASQREEAIVAPKKKGKERGDKITKELEVEGEGKG